MTLLLAASTDAVLLVYAYIAAACVELRFSGAPAPMLYTLLAHLPWFIGLHLFFFSACRAYDFGRFRGEADLAFSALLGLALGAAASLFASTMYILYYEPHTPVVGRAVFTWALLAAAVLLPGWRIAWTRLRRNRGELAARITVIGPLGRTRPLIDALEQAGPGEPSLAGMLTEEEIDEALKVDGLESLLEGHAGDTLIIAGETLARRPTLLPFLMELSRKKGLPIHLLPQWYEAAVGNIHLLQIHGVPLLELTTPQSSGAYPVIKRLLDLLGASFSLVLLSPVLPLIAIFVKLDSPGPVLFRQTRCGRDGRIFTMLKFRTMRLDAEEETGPVWAAKDDPRVTRLGRLLRRQRWDEIPQFWNVLMGDMTLVGPRPERPELMEQFQQELPLYPLRLKVTPGVTSLSHVLGHYDTAPAYRLLYDLAYINQRSLWLDVRILLATVKIVLTGRGAQ